MVSEGALEIEIVIQGALEVYWLYLYHVSRANCYVISSLH